VSAAEPAALAVRRVSKSFEGLRALDQASLAVRPGEIHGLLGENGSGKSTLIKIIAGYHAPDSPVELAVGGRTAKLPLPPGRARELGIAFVHQDLGLIPSLSVAENLWLDELAARRDWWISWRLERDRACQALARFEIYLDPGQPVARLRPVERALLAIVRAVEEMRSGPAERGVLVLDEPTVFLPDPERRRLLALVRGLAGEGASVLFVSHDLDEALEFADRITVLRDGRSIATVATEELDRNSLAELMTGRPLEVAAARNSLSAPVAASVVGLTGDAVRSLSFDVRTGEVLGLTGLLGSGFDEVLYLLFGARPSRSGCLVLGGASYDTTSLTPARAVRAGMALVPADRELDASVGSLPIVDNVMLPVLDRYRTWLTLDRERMLRDTADLLSRFGVRPNEPRLPFRALSGGNQQKALLAKALNTGPRLLLLDGPTRGVDVGARAQIFGLIRAAAEAGAAVVCASTDREELDIVCDRVLVLADGRAVEERAGR
jgi:ribose transport system ATP-binding protein